MRILATIAALAACAAYGAGVNTAPFGDIGLNNPVVTNVTFSGLATQTDIGAFAATGSVGRATTYGTPNRWVDATGCVWEVVVSFGQWTMTSHTGWIDDQIAQWVGPYWWTDGGPDPEMHDGDGDTPLSEVEELYSIDIFATPGAVTPVRTVDGLTSPEYTYTAADQVADGFVSPPDQLTFAVYQVGTYFGRGMGNRVTLYVEQP